MGCRDGFANTGMIIKIAFFIVFISMFCNWLAFTTNSWYRVDNMAYIGLWRSAVLVTSGTGASAVSAWSYSQTDGTPSTKFGVIQAFACVGFVTQNIGFVLICLYMFRNKCRGNSETRIAAGVFLILSMVGWLISVAIFGAEYTNGAENLHYSFALAVCACGLGLFGGILMLIGGRGHHGSVGHK